MKPRAIRLFGLVYLLWMAGAIGWEAYLFFPHKWVGIDTEDAQIHVASWAFIAAHLVLNLVLWRFTVVRPRMIARTVFNLLLALGGALLLLKTVLAWQMDDDMSYTPLLSFAVQLYLAWLLYLPASTRWLRLGRDTPEAVLEETFR